MPEGREHFSTHVEPAPRPAAPLVKGRHAKHLWGGAVAASLVVPALARSLSTRRRNSSRKAGKSGRLSIIFGSALTLAGGLALKWALTHAGRDSAEGAT